MRKVIKAAAAFVMSTICMGAFPLCGQASIYVSDSDMILEIEDEIWNEISDPYTLHTFTNGTDVITVLKYGKYEELPRPVKAGEKYEAVYQTIYSTGDETYIVTGSAVRAENISSVKEVIDSIVYPAKESDTENSKTNTVHEENYPGEDVVELVNLRGDITTVYKLIDGRYMDRVNRIFIFDGVDTWTDENGAQWNETVR